MKLKYIIYIILPFLLWLDSVSAQNVSGTVCDIDGNPLTGATVYWADTTVGTSAGLDGEFSLHRVKGFDNLVASYIGYQNDTLSVVHTTNPIKFALVPDGELVDAVVVEGRVSGNFILQEGILKNEMISFAGLCKMACCNLAESFENSASVTVGYSDAISGARQIKMLGLTGTYTQLLDENRPIMRGLSAPYGLSYTPGMWLNSIQVSKGISSVTAGHEAITGQINLEHRKPTDDERLFLNLYFDSDLRPEINLSSAIHLTEDKSLSTIILAHASMDTKSQDMNHDGFRDTPQSNQQGIANRWFWQLPNGMQMRWGAKYTRDGRLGGDMNYTPSMRDQMLENKIYGSSILNQYANAYFKLGAPVGKSVYDPDEETELRSNLAFIADYSWFDEDAYFGLNDYRAAQHSVLTNLMYNHYFSLRHSLIAGLTATADIYDEYFINNKVSHDYDLSRSEIEIGAYAEYTYNIDDRFSAVAGLRADYDTYFRKGYFTPRGHIKWNLAPKTVLRASAGLGYRPTNVIADNIGILATGRTIIFNGDTTTATYLLTDRFDRMESAATFGGSLTQTLSLAKSGDATLSFDYFRTQFFNRVIADQEWDSDYVNIYASSGRSFTDNYQVDLTWSPIDRFDIFATFRYTNARQTINRPDGSTMLVESPLVSRFKTLLNLQYATRFRRWVFDFTAQYNGKSRLPSLDGDLNNLRYSPAYPMLYAQISYRIKHWDIYAGCENILNYHQHDPILLYGERIQHGADPFADSSFNSTVVWGPLMGRKIYIGVRFNLY